MLTIEALKAGREAGSYYTNDPKQEARPDRRDEYYAGAGGEGGGIWWSSSSTIVRDGAPVEKDVFRDLCAGLDPSTGDSHRTAKGLVRGAGEKHRAGWDLTFSAPKSASLLWAAGSKEQREAIRAAHGAAVAEALRFIDEEGLVEVRLGAGGTRRERATDTLVARFDHYTSRAGDPNLHTHCVLLNVARSPDGKCRTLEPRPLYRWTKVVGAAYRLRLAERLREHGFRTREAGRGQIEIAGVPQPLIDRFSKRGAEIEAATGDRADATSRQKEVANLATRQGKDRLPTGAELEALWIREFADDLTLVWDQALAAGRNRDRQREASRTPAIGQRVPDPFPSAPEVAGHGAVARAASALLRHEIVIDRRELLQHSFVLAALDADGTAGAVQREIKELERSDALRPLGPSEGRDRRWTTPTLAAIEAAMVEAVRRPDEREWFQTGAVEAALEDVPHLSDEQMNAVRSISSRDGVDILLASAGTGKTTAMSALVGAAERSELNVIALAPSWTAADELAKGTGTKAYATAKWLYDLRQGKVKGPDDRTVIVVDEASMVGTRDLSEIATRAQDAGAKVILVGDTQQLEAVPAGGALRLVANELERQATISRVRRQQIDWQRDASIALAKGETEKALAAYAERGVIETVEGRDALLDQTIKRWRELRAEHGDDVLIVTRRNRDVAELNGKVRAILQEDGVIARNDRELPSIDRQGKRSLTQIAKGDRLRFGATHSTLGLRNGTRATVRTVGRGTDPRIRLALEDGREIEAVWSELATDRRGSGPRVVHDYAGTVYSAQGRTVRSTVLCVATAVDQRDLYVGMTRHSHELNVVVDGAAIDLGQDAIRPHFKRNVRGRVPTPELVPTMDKAPGIQR